MINIRSALRLCRFFCAVFCLSILYPLPLQATPIIADLSQYRIEIDASFNGTRIFLFGVRNDTGDVVVVIRGPERDYMLRKKEPVMGIWANRDRMKFYGVPDFYAIALSKPLEEVASEMLLQRLEIGEKSLMTPPPNPAIRERFQEYMQAFLEFQQRRRLYITTPVQLEFMGESLFKSVIEFPDTIPAGDYTAEVYLISNGEVVGMQSTPITVSKSGLDAFLYDYAHNSPVLYGLTAVVMALSAGWFASRAFEKI